MSGESPATARYRHRPETVATERGPEDAPAVVFSHGTLMDSTMFTPQLEALSDEYRAVAYDSRARTDRYAEEYDLRDLADDCAALLDALDIDSCVLGGMSMGGFTALRFALRHPDRVDGLVIIDSMACQHEDDEREEYRELLDLLADLDDLPEYVADDAAESLWGDTTIEERPDLVEHWRNRWLTYPADSLRYEMGSWVDRPDLTDRLDEIDIPVLVVHGEEDEALPMDGAEETAEGLPEGRLVRVPEAGHSSNLERPDIVNDAIREFLAEVY